MKPTTFRHKGCQVIPEKHSAGVYFGISKRSDDYQINFVRGTWPRGTGVRCAKGTEARKYIDARR